MKKKLTLVVSLLLVMALSIGGTIAWLTDTTDAIQNTFTVGNVKIALTETDVENNKTPLANSYKMIPGAEIEKDPVVTVIGGSEACWLFVKIDESDNLDDFISYTVDSAWTEVESGVYYKEVASSTADQPFSVLTDNKVTVKGTVTQGMMDEIADPNKNVAEPTLTFTAYAIQSANLKNADETPADTAAEAWALVKPAS